MKKVLNKIFSRILIVGCLIALQAAWFLVFMYRLTDYSMIANLILKLISVAAVIQLVSTDMNSDSKLAWTVPILLFPLLGGLMYLLFYQRKPTKGLRTKLEAAADRVRPLVPSGHEILNRTAKDNKIAAGQMRYLQQIAGYEPFEDTEAEYFPSGEAGFPTMLEELRKAEHFIFLEYFIIREGEMWGKVHEILKEKAEAGLDVRVIYDDVGSLTYLPFAYREQLEQEGIRCEAFNRFVPFLSVVMNHRDHRKILVIDGHTGFSGGINLGDEYINITSEYGYWKDNVILLRGEGVWGLTVMFLSMWNGIRPTDEHFEKYRPHTYHPEPFAGKGVVQPYSDSPLDDENVGENVYLNMIHGAQESLEILNPYVVLDDQLVTALCLAAKRGVDVRLIIPAVSDHKIIGWVAESYFPHLMRQGVKIYCYQPGFLHAKVFFCDGKLATVGTVNLDYRSLYHHFECGILLYDTPCLAQIEADIEDTYRHSTALTLETIEHGTLIRLVQKLLRIFAPLI